MSALIVSLLTSKVAIGIGAVFIAIVGAFMRGRISGGKREREKQAADKLKAAEERLEMHREATDFERRAAGMTDEEARKEALKWRG